MARDSGDVGARVVAEIRPFAGLRYNLDRVALSDVIAPPYDVISREHRRRLIDRHPLNAIRLILGDPSTLRPDELADFTRYHEAAHVLSAWTADRSLQLDSTPSFCLMEETFRWGEQLLTRRGVFITVKLEEFGKGSILPHERTLATPIEDRLRLMRATRSHLSPVYMTCLDEGGKIGDWMSAASREKPLSEFKNRDEEISYRLWRVADEDATKRLVEHMQPRSLLIADGHHRYTTALHYAREMRDESAEADWMLAYVALANDPGVVLSAIHRICETGMELSELLLKLQADFRAEPVDRNFAAFEKSGAPFALVAPGDPQIYLLFARESVTEVPTALLDQHIVKPLLGIDGSRPEDQKRVRYIKKQDELFASMRTGEIGFWLRPLTVPQVIRIAERGEVLPQKSTFFYPKVPTGIVFHPVTDR